MRFALITATALTAGLLVGCKDEPATTPPPATQAATQPSEADRLKAEAEDAAKAGSDAATKAAKGVGDAATKAVEDVDGAAGKIKEGADDAAGKVKDATAGGADAGGMTAKTKDEAQKLHDQAMKAVKEKNFTAAESSVEKLEKMKPQLSPEWQDKVATLKSTVETAKKAGDVKIPGDDK